LILRRGLRKVRRVGLRKWWVELLVIARLHHFGVMLGWMTGECSRRLDFDVFFIYVLIKMLQ